MKTSPARAVRALVRHDITLAALGLLALAACSAPAEDDSDVAQYEGAPGAGATPGTGSGTPAPSDPAATPPNGAPSTPTTATPPSGLPSAPGNGEQNPASGAPIAPSGDPRAGAGGASMVGTDDGAVGAAGSSMGVAGSTNLPGEPPPVAPTGATPEEITTFFASLPCGAKYTALGDGGWQFCLRLADGGAACARGSAEFQRVTFAGGDAVTNVAQVSGQRDSGVGVVTTDGALFVGGVTSVATEPLIASGVINYSGGFHASVALVEQGAGLGVVSWTDNGAPAPVTLPDGAQPIQVSANYGLACALSTAGDAYCWNAGGNHSLPLTDAPTRVAIARPLQLISVGQNSVCGVSFDATLECQAAWYDSPYLPTEGAAPNFQVRQSSFPAVREVHAGFGQGIVVRADGTAAYLGGGIVPPSDNPGEPFTGVANVVAAGGDRGSACVQDTSGAVFCRTGAGVARATLGGAPLTAQAAACPR